MRDDFFHADAADFGSTAMTWVEIIVRSKRAVMATNAAKMMACALARRGEGGNARVERPGTLAAVRRRGPASVRLPGFPARGNGAGGVPAGVPTVQDAEDACQAAFLVLARKAGEGRRKESVANWLFTTARRIAAIARRDAERRCNRERKAARREAVGLDQMTGREAFEVLDEELENSGEYREPLVLCYLEGLTRDEAAARLQLPMATLKSQLERARKKLGDALTRRGVVLGAGFLALAVTSPAGAAPPRLIEAVLASVAGSPTAAVAALAKGVTMQ